MKTMKKLKYISFALITILSLISCENDLETAPTNQANEEEIFKTAESAETVINGTWAKFNDDGTTYSNIGYSTVLRTSDAMGSDVAVLTNKYGFREPMLLPIWSIIQEAGLFLSGACCIPPSTI
jgi:uncharacterized lipoprotein NlpE involved in copper resistance